jgi:hypothetical protein
MPLSPKEQAEYEQLRQQFEGEGQAPMEDQPSEQIIQEQHPDISFGQRFVAKNLANSPESQIAYLKSKNPNLEVSSMQGQVVVRNKGEPWKVLDPSGFDAQDITDVGYDIGAGVGTGAATAAGGLAGAPLGPGALVTAGGAGAAAAGGLEGLRQKLGQYMGVPQEVDYGQVKTQAAFGAASPLVFGTGAGAGQIAAKALASKLPAEAIKQSQRGLVSKGVEGYFKNVLPKVGEMVSGVPAEAIRTYGKNPKAVNDLTESGIMDITTAAHDKIRTGLAEAKSKVGQRLEQEVGVLTNADGTPRTVNIGRAREELDSIIAKMESKPTAKNPEIRERIAELKAARDNIFKEYQEVQTKAPNENLASMLSALPEEEANALLKSSGLTKADVFGAVEEKLVPLPDQVSPQHAFEIQDLLSRSGDLGKIKEGLKGRFTSTQAKADKEWAEGSRKAYNVLNEELDTATEGVSSELKGEYKKYIKLQNNLNKYFSTPEKTYQTLKGIDTPHKQYLRETLKEVKDMTGVDVNDEAKVLEAYTYFSKPGLTPVSSKGTTSTSRTMGLGGVGGALGYKLGGPMGMMLGAGAGNVAGSPAAVKMYTDMVSGSANLARPLYNTGAGIAPDVGISTWNMMQNKERGR